MNLPVLYKLTSTGATQMWYIMVVPADKVYPYPEIRTTYGQKDGKLQVATEYIYEGKNLGKANETTAHEQACLEAKATWEQKKKKGYVEKIEDAKAGKVDTNSITGGILPMLAESYAKQGHKISFPAYVQPKLDGHRCIAIIQDGKCTLWSRTRKPINSMPHIVKQLEDLFASQGDATVILDGELYNHEYRDKFEDLTSLIRQEKPASGHEVLQYWIYDTVNIGATQTWPFSARNTMLKQLEQIIVARGFNKLNVLATFEVEDEADMVEKFGVFVNHGYEGLMIRNAKGLYKSSSSRSSDLQKVKTFEDAEFEVTGIVAGKGKMSDKALFVCKTDSGESFQVKMKGELDSLKKYLLDPDTYIGEQLTVQFQGLTSKGVPRFPVAIRFHKEL